MCYLQILQNLHTHTHTLALTPGYIHRPAETCINVHHMTDRAYTLQIKSYYAAEQDPSPQEQEN